MKTPILICDDSSFAQKQLTRALPDDREVEVFFASDGNEAMMVLHENPIPILFLDLNMPGMDGYGVLTAIKEEGIQIQVVVVSGDIQPEAHRRVMELGALEFIKKPVEKSELRRVIDEYELTKVEVQTQVHNIHLEMFDAYREVTNVAMGQAADLLARVLNTFVIMPIPSVNMIEATELQMALNQVSERENVSAICQGFVGGGLAGEAMLLFSDSSYKDIAEMTHFEGDLDEIAEIELLMDLTNILIGACLKGIAEQFDIQLSIGHPSVLGRHVRGEDLLGSNISWKSTLAIDMQISLENRNVQGNLLLLFTEDSIERFDQLISYAAA